MQAARLMRAISRRSIDHDTQHLPMLIGMCTAAVSGDLNLNPVSVTLRSSMHARAMSNGCDDPTYPGDQWVQQFKSNTRLPQYLNIVGITFVCEVNCDLGSDIVTVSCRYFLDESGRLSLLQPKHTYAHFE